MAAASARVPTANGAKYVKQLCNHWAHKLPVDLNDDRGLVRFPAASATLAAGPGELTVTIDANDAATLEIMKDVVARHLERFAFREAPLPFAWSTED